MYDSYCPITSSHSSFHLHPSKHICSPPDPVKLNCKVMPSDTPGFQELQENQQKGRGERISCACWAKDRSMNSSHLHCLTQRPSQTRVWFSLSWIFLQVKRSRTAEGENNCEDITKNCMKPSFTVHRTTYLIRYLGHTVIVNHDHDDASCSSTKCHDKKYHSASSVYYS